MVSFIYSSVFEVEHIPADNTLGLSDDESKRIKHASVIAGRRESPSVGALKRIVPRKVVQPRMNAKIPTYSSHR